MKLVLYSGGSLAANALLHEALVGLIGNKRRKSMTYVPFSSSGAAPFLERFKRRYRAFGVEDFRYLPLDEPLSRDQLKRAFDADAIYLAGGNTFYFLHHLRETGVLKRLHRFVRDGGVLAGLSAGAVIMTPHIRLAGFPPFAADRNTVGMEDLSALGLVQFEFFPHYAKNARLIEALKRYSRKSIYPMIATRDGGGVVVKGDRFEFVGKSELFVDGMHGAIS